MLMQPERFADEAANAVALDGAAGCSTATASPRRGPALSFQQRGHAEKSIAEAPSARVGRLEIALAPQAPCAGR